jgi:hypothetical protein
MLFCSALRKAQTDADDDDDDDDADNETPQHVSDVLIYGVQH